MEILLLIFVALGSLCGLAGAIWTIIIAIQNEEWLYGIGGIFCGLLLLVYAIQNFDECKIPLGLMGIGIVTSVATQLMAAAVG